MFPGSHNLSKLVVGKSENVAREEVSLHAQFAVNEKVSRSTGNKNKYNLHTHTHAHMHV